MTLSRLPGPLRWAVRLLAVEAAAAAVGAGLVGYEGIAGEPTDPGAALAVAGFAAVLGAALAGLAVALARRAPRARAPAIVLQLLAAMFAYVLVTAGNVGLGIPVAVLAVATATLLLTPSTTAALG